MPRYGDLDALFNERPEYLNPQHETNGEYNRGWNACNEHYSKLIRNAPTADVVEVVRCKKCKWNSKLFKDVMFSRCLHPRSMTLIEHQDTHFCGYGERETDE